MAFAFILSLRVYKVKLLYMGNVRFVRVGLQDFPYEIVDGCYVTKRKTISLTVKCAMDVHENSALLHDLLENDQLAYQRDFLKYTASRKMTNSYTIEPLSST